MLWRYNTLFGTVSIGTVSRVRDQSTGLISPVPQSPHIEGNGNLCIFGNTVSTIPVKYEIRVVEVKTEGSIQIAKLQGEERQLIQPGIYRYE